MPTEDLSRSLIRTMELHAMQIDLRNDGRYRSTYVLDEYFHGLLSRVRPQIFIEAGAFDAAASRRAAAQLPGTMVYAFEANPSNYAIWTRAVDFESEGVAYLPLALSDRPGSVTFRLRSSDAPDAFEDNSILPHVDADGSGPSVQVEATTLDSFFGGHEGRVAMWVDVEGANEQVLGGGLEVLSRCDVLKIEVEDVPLWRGQWLARDVVSACLDAGLMPVARDVQALGQYNIVLVRDELLADRGVREVTEELWRRQLSPELPGVLGKVRRSAGARGVARGVRGALRRG